MDGSGATDGWVKATTIGTLFAVVAVASVGVLEWKLHEADAATTRADLASLRADLAAIREAVDRGAGGTWVHGKETVQDCVATNQLFQCTVTNITDQPLSACWIGVLGQKKGGGSMRSFPLCTGRVGPRKTRFVSSPWERGVASDICNKVSASETRTRCTDPVIDEARGVTQARGHDGDGVEVDGASAGGGGRAACRRLDVRAGSWGSKASTLRWWASRLGSRGHAGSGEGEAAGSDGAGRAAGGLRRPTR